MLRTKVAGLVLASALAASTAFSAALPAYADGEVSISHYFTGELGRVGLEEIFKQFTAETGVSVVDSPIGHEDFKTGILVRAAGNSLPDVFSYWAGARTQFVVDAGNLHSIAAMWDANGLGDVVAKSIADGATLYNGDRYLVPFGYHYAGMFYNKKVMADAGITDLPKTWEEFVALCDTLKAKGVTPIALGSKNRWPAQFWFDYLVLRTAGPEYRAALMAGTASYTDDQVKLAMQKWKELVDAGYFAPNANADDWTDAADKVARGDAAMTLMGTWITGYWNGIELKPGEDYDFFEFPKMADGVANAAVGPVDGLVISGNAPNMANAEKLLTFLVSNPEVQAKWAGIQGALSANVKVDPANYTSVMQHALATISNAEAFAFNYDLATPPPVAEVGLSMFARFMDDPASYETILTETQAAAADAFKQ
ncbi:ABC transporter substrate-binding protein [Devosia sp.]|uniref:ABC transporter substrate-binding protein n=1 Tax=Devosia sp. TaxID=1871048 RepID=UPI0035ADBAD9